MFGICPIIFKNKQIQFLNIECFLLFVVSNLPFLGPDSALATSPPSGLLGWRCHALPFADSKPEGRGRFRLDPLLILLLLAPLALVRRDKRLVKPRQLRVTDTRSCTLIPCRDLSLELR